MSSYKWNFFSAQFMVSMSTEFLSTQSAQIYYLVCLGIFTLLVFATILQRIKYLKSGIFINPSPLHTTTPYWVIILAVSVPYVNLLVLACYIVVKMRDPFK